MPSEESRRLLKAFGIAVTDLEDALEKVPTKEELARADAEVTARLEEVNQLIQRLRSARRSS